jgi:glycine betaine/choline ABC-type transport system substrate-binding protein
VASKKAKDRRLRRLARFRTVSIGDVCELEECCREIRLGATPLFVGKRLDGWNTLTDAYEVWEVVRITDECHGLVKRIE